MYVFSQYRFFGEFVVKAAVENGCHHLDISGEPEVLLIKLHLFDLGAFLVLVSISKLLPLPSNTVHLLACLLEKGINKLTVNLSICTYHQFLEKMQLKYHESAKAAGVHIIGTCGFDSIPADIGVLFTSQNFPGKQIGIYKTILLLVLKKVVSLSLSED